MLLGAKPKRRKELGSDSKDYADADKGLAGMNNMKMMDCDNCNEPMI